MRIIHIIDSGGLYGAEVMLLNLIAAQMEMGLDPTLVSIGTPDCLPKQIEKKARELGINTKTIRMKAGLNISGARSICKLAASENAAILHSHGYKGNILLGLLPLFWRKTPLVTTLHGWTWTGQLNRMMLYEWLDSISLRFVDHVVLVNRMMEGHRRLRGLPANRKAIVNNGIDFATANRQATLLLPESIQEFLAQKFTVVGVGRFSPEKDFPLLVRAIADLVNDGHDLQLLLLGDGGLRGELTALTKELDIVDRVLMPGFVDNIYLYLKHCQLFAMPSLTEGLPMALLEAMHAEIPIVASQVGGIPDALQGGNAGTLIEPGNLEDLTNELRRAFLAPGRNMECVSLAKELVMSEFSNDKMAKNYLKVYQQVLEQVRA
jgi:glycosyltransferase involved in cell wall biosynthesis